MADHGKIPRPKTQKEILLSNPAQDTYKNPENGETTGNPNRAFPDRDNRGNQVSFRGDKVKPFSLGLKENDEALFYYLENVIKPTVMQNGVVTKVPVYYGSPERWAQVQKEGYYRDLKGKIMMPVITYKRNNVEKVRNLSNKLDANGPKNVQLFQKPYSQRNEYDNFNILNNRIPKKESYAVVVPDYVILTYDFIISTYYVEQMNKIVEAINYASDSYWGDPERFKFRAMIDNFTNVVETNQGQERVVKTTFNIKLNGYIIPEVVQKSMNAFNKFNNKTKIIFSMEVIAGNEFFEGTGDGSKILTPNSNTREAEKKTTIIS